MDMGLYYAELDYFISSQKFLDTRLDQTEAPYRGPDYTFQG